MKILDIRISPSYNPKVNPGRRDGTRHPKMLIGPRRHEMPLLGHRSAMSPEILVHTNIWCSLPSLAQKKKKTHAHLSPSSRSDFPEATTSGTTVHQRSLPSLLPPLLPRISLPLSASPPFLSLPHSLFFPPEAATWRWTQRDGACACCGRTLVAPPFLPAPT